MTSAQEIAQLEHELATLRSRYEIMKRNGQRAKAFFYFVLIPVIGGLTILLLIKDFVAGLFVAIPLTAFSALAWLYRDKRPRWIDIGTPQSEFDFGPSEAGKVELWIATRERRLAELQPERNSN
jgi:hypothetical protein